MQGIIGTHCADHSEFDVSKLPPPNISEDELSRAYSYTGDYLLYQKCARQYMIFREYGFIASRLQTQLFGTLVHVGKGIFYSRPTAEGEDNEMIAICKHYEGTGGKFVEHTEGATIFPGAWLTGSVPREYPEHNRSGTGGVQTPEGVAEDNIPEDQSLVLNTPRGLVVVTGCGHAGIVNILTYTRASYSDLPVHGVVGGVHLFAASDEQLNWTGDEFKEFQVANLLGAHCTGIEAVYRLRDRAGLSRQTAVVGTVGSTFTLKVGITPGGHWPSNGRSIGARVDRH